MIFNEREKSMADKALLLGINDYKKVNPLRGCVNDVDNMYKLLTEVFKFNSSNVKRLLNEKVVKKDVKAQMAWLLKDAKPNDRIVFHYSGHGSQIVDLDGDEDDDGADEILCLYDMDFGDPDTYLCDDELQEWTKKLPAGVQLTIVLDSCHSGTGTRMLMTPLSGNSSKLVPVMVDPNTTVARALKGFTQTRGLGAAEAALLATDPENDDLVRVRFVEPPQAIKDAIAARGEKGNRGLVVAKMNHILLAGCKDNQTSADATIEQMPNGAFTFHLCKTIRAGGANLERKELIGRIERALRDGHFTQQPQLEGPTNEGPLFGGNRDPNGVPSNPTIEVPGISPNVETGELKDMIPLIALLAPEAQVEALRLVGSRSGSQRTGNQRVVGNRYLIYVHGICKHDPGYSDGWWNALQPFTSAFGAGTLGDKRREVLWSDLVNERALEAKVNRAVDNQAARQADEQERLKEAILEALNDRRDQRMIDAIPESAEGDAPRALVEERALDDTRALSIPGLNCVDDFTVYMVNDAVRGQVIGRFTSVVQPLLESGAELDIISHSWGTVVAYEGLREMADRGVIAGQVRNFFTVGAALSIGPVKASLRLANKDGRRPAMVKRWVNLDARGDIVGGPLLGRPYAVDNDFPSLAPFGCGSFFGIVNPSCAHSSYFVSGNDAVNRDVFAAFIARA
ncbi:MAG: caspase family protein [Planctomycetota bacterium]|nr:caspase family protein [Planctomycetota bacterium]